VNLEDISALVKATLSELNIGMASTIKNTSGAFKAFCIVVKDAAIINNISSTVRSILIKYSYFDSFLIPAIYLLFNT
jgi:hypothetical protein